MDIKHINLADAPDGAQEFVGKLFELGGALDALKYLVEAAASGNLIAIRSEIDGKPCTLLCEVDGEGNVHSFAIPLDADGRNLGALPKHNAAGAALAIKLPQLTVRNGELGFQGMTYSKDGYTQDDCGDPDCPVHGKGKGANAIPPADVEPTKDAIDEAAAILRRMGMH